jgi:hypothetical protein
MPDTRARALAVIEAALHETGGRLICDVGSGYVYATLGRTEVFAGTLEAALTALAEKIEETRA